MGVHPNVLLMAVLTPDDLTRKTFRAIVAEAGLDPDDLDGGQIKIEGEKYWPIVMEDDYNESFQVGAPEGSIVLLDMVTYGYGESVTWEKLETQKGHLLSWANGICERHHCKVEIRVGANHW